MSKFFTGAYDRVEKAKKGCKRCGSHDVAWRESTTGKWYLIEVFDFGDPEIGPDFRSHYRDFHSGYCGKPELHLVEQRSIESQLGIEREEKTKLRVEQEERNAARESEFFLALHDLCKNNPEQARKELAEREDKLAFEHANYVSMDYFTEHCKQEALVKRLKTEIAFMQAALGMVSEDD
jgi:hypothetical protein